MRNALAWVVMLTALQGLACHGEPAPVPPAGADSANADHGGANLLKDLPPTFTDLIVTEANAGTLTRANALILEYVYNNYPLTEPERDDVERYRTYLRALEANQRPQPRGDLVLSEHRLTLHDPGPLYARVQTLDESVTQSVCPRFTPAAKHDSGSAQDGPGSARDQHNLLVFYARNYAHKCGAPIRWMPESDNPRLFELHRILSQPEQAYAGLKSYLPKDFAPRFELFIALYFQYLELSLEARDINHPLRELLNGQTDLRDGSHGSLPRYPEMTELADTLDRGQKMKLWN
jgi:hypothetical protein